MKKFKVALVLCLVFLAGLASGVVGTRIVVRAFIRRVLEHPELVRIRIEHDLTRNLKLDREQQDKVRKILEQSHGELRDLRKETQPKFVKIFTNAEEQISAVLTPEQQQKWEKLKAANRRILPLPK